MKTRVRRVAFILGFAVGLDVLMSVLCFIVVLKQEAAPYSANTDVGMILMGDFDRRGASLGAKTLLRLDHALDLYREKRIDSFLCVGGARPKRNVYGSELMSRYLLSRGVPSYKILQERQSYSTETNWEYSRRIIQGQRWTAVTLITSVLHQHRLKKIVASNPITGIDIFYSPVPTVINYSIFDLGEIWMEIHYEWAAGILDTLPDTLETKIVRLLRAQ